MKGKKIFLRAGLAVVALTLIAFAIWAIQYVIYAHNYVETYVQEHPHYSGSETIGWPSPMDIVFVAIIVLAPILLSELSLIRNGCLLFEGKQSAIRKVCCVLSSALALLAVVILLAAMTGVIDRFYYAILGDDHYSVKVYEITLLLPLPMAIVSLLLGGKGLIRRKPKTR